MTIAASSIRDRRHGPLSARLRFDKSPCAWTNLALYLLVATAILLDILRKTHGHFTYFMDDPYIHLALAERLRHGLYGINAGEFASSSSSILWPLLLVPFAGTTLMPWVPLIVNVLCSGATAWLLGRFVDVYFLRGWRSRMFAVLLLAATNIFGLTFTGLEHPLEVLLCVASAFAVLHVLRGERVPSWCVVAAALLPSVRYEGFLVTFAVAVALWAANKRKTAALLLGISLVPVAVFSVVLHHLGLPWLPMSVLMKGSWKFQDHSIFPVRVARLVITALKSSLEDFERVPQLVLVLVLAVLAWQNRHTRRVWLALAGCAAAGALQVVLGPVGWSYRYEIYCLAFTLLVAIAAALPAIAHGYAAVQSTLHANQELIAAAHGKSPVEGMLLLLVALLAILYEPPLVLSPQAASGIYKQQAQMGRFASEFYTAPVAVNDLGVVAFDRTPQQYVLDLEGLGSYEAFQIKEAQHTPAWLDAITREHHTGLVMIYPEWFPKGLPASWIAVAKLCSTGVTPGLGAAKSRVMFYATPAANRAELQAALQRFKPTLPQGATMQLNPADTSESCDASTKTGDPSPATRL